MALQLSEAVRNAMLDAIEATIGASAVLKIYDLTAGAPADTSAAITGTVLATCNLPSDWLDDADDGAVSMLGTWQDASADNSGTADFFRLFASDGTTCHGQGTVTGTGGGGDMTVDNTSFASGQAFNVTSFTIADNNG